MTTDTSTFGLTSVPIFTRSGAPGLAIPTFRTLSWLAEVTVDPKPLARGQPLHPLGEVARAWGFDHPHMCGPGTRLGTGEGFDHPHVCGLPLVPATLSL